MVQQQVEAEKLRKKLDELMSDRAPSSEDEEDPPKRGPPQPRSLEIKSGPLVAPTPEEENSSSSSDEPTEAQKARSSIYFAQKLS